MASTPCAKCNEPLGTRASVSSSTKTYHQECMSCHSCGKNLVTEGTYFEDEGLPYCEYDFCVLRGLICAGCDKAVTGSYITQLGKNWHPEHFKCAACATPLAGQTFYTQDNAPYCKPDYLDLFVDKCDVCQTPLEDEYMQLKEPQLLQFHTHCYKAYVKDPSVLKPKREKKAVPVASAAAAAPAAAPKPAPAAAAPAAAPAAAKPAAKPDALDELFADTFGTLPGYAAPAPAAAPVSTTTTTSTTTTSVKAAAPAAAPAPSTTAAAKTSTTSTPAPAKATNSQAQAQTSDLVVDIDAMFADTFDSIMGEPPGTTKPGTVAATGGAPAPAPAKTPSTTPAAASSSPAVNRPVSAVSATSTTTATSKASPPVARKGIPIAANSPEFHAAQEEIQKLREKLKKTEADLDQSKQKVASLQANADATDNQLAGARRREQDLRRDNEDLANKLKSSQSASGSDITKFKSDLATSESLVATLKTQLAAAQKDADSARASIDTSSKQLQVQLAAKDKELAELKTKLASSEESLYASQQKLAEEKKATDLLKLSAASSAGTAAANNGSAEKELIEVKGALAEKELLAKKLNSQLETSQSEQTKLQESLEAAKKDLQASSNEKTQLSTQLHLLEKKVVAAEQFAPLLQSAQSTASDLKKDLEREQAKVKDLTGRLASTEDKLAKAGNSASNQPVADPRVGDLENLVGTLTGKLEAANNQIQSLQGQLDAAQNSIFNGEDPSGGAGGPPPPPPPPPGPPPPPSALSAPATPNAVSSSDLMAQIQAGAKLKKAEVNPDSPKLPRSGLTTPTSPMAGMMADMKNNKLFLNAKRPIS